MPASFAGVLNSRLFKFIVGENVTFGGPTEFLVHQAAIVELSEPLRNLLTGELIEAQAGCTKWPDVNIETFEHFVQFAYTGDYSIPKARRRKQQEKPTSVTNGLHNPPEVEFEEIEDAISHPPVVKGWTPEPEEPEPQEVPPPVSEDDTWGSFATKKNKRGKKSAYETPPPPVPLYGTDFGSLVYHLKCPRIKYIDTCEPSKKFYKTRNYSEVLLCHASLYVLADLWMVDSLKALSLFKLHQTLSIFELDDSNAKDVLDLAKFAYEDEGLGSEGGVGGLRDLVCRFMVMNSVALSTNGGFMDLIKEGGAFAADMWTYEVQKNHY